MDNKEIVSLNAKQVSRILFQFYDAPVPPPFHRSYVITIANNTVDLKVTSYRKTINEIKFDLLESDFIALINTINQARLVSVTIHAAKGCVGGKKEKLFISQMNQIVYTGDFDYCGGMKIPEKYGAVKEVMKQIKALIHNLSSHLKG